MFNCILGRIDGKDCEFIDPFGRCKLATVTADITRREGLADRIFCPSYKGKLTRNERKTSEIGEVTFRLNVDCSEALKQLDEVEERMKRLSRGPTVNRMVDRLTEDDIRRGLVIHPLTGLKHDKDLEAKGSGKG